MASVTVLCACSCMSAGAQAGYDPGTPSAWSHSFYGADQAGKKPTDYQRGLQALDQRHWAEAVEAFSVVVKRNGSAMDGALYWKAYAENRLGDNAAALRTVEQLKEEKPESKWVEDAKALEVEVRLALGKAVSSTADADVNVKLLVINNLITAKPDIALPALQNILNGSSPFQVKDRALFVLAQNPTPEARRLLHAVAQDMPDRTLRANAIRYVDLLGGKPGTLQKLGMVAPNEKAEELIAMFKREPNAEVRNSILKALAMGNHTKALIDLARHETDPQRKAEITRYLPLLRPDKAMRYQVELLRK